jgi:hypothetical protein
MTEENFRRCRSWQFKFNEESRWLTCPWALPTGAVAQWCSSAGKLWRPLPFAVELGRVAEGSAIER